jgi:hypothetical protein
MVKQSRRRTWLCCKFTGWAGVASLVLLALPARADHVLTVDAKGGFGGPTGLILLDASFGGSPLGAWSGIQTARLDGGSPFDAYCVDFYHDNYVPVGYEVTPKHIGGLLSTPLGSGPIGGNGAGIGYLYDTNAAAASSDHFKAAGLQAAIWTLEYDGGFKVLDAPSSDGLTGSDQARAAYWASIFLNDYGLHGKGKQDDATWYQATHVGSLYQDLVGPPTGRGGPALAPVPEPSSLVLTGLGTVALLGYRWHRRGVLVR